MTIAYLLRILWSWRLFIILSGLGCCAIGGAVASTLQPLYQSVARVELEMMRPDSVTGQRIDPKYISAYVATQAQLIGDYGVAGRAADAGGFTSSSVMAAQYRDSGAASRMDFRRWIAQSVINSTSVGLEEEGNVLEIRYTAGTPEAAAGMAELVRAAYIDEVIATERGEAVENAAWFSDQAQAIRERLAAAEQEMRDFERQTGIVLANRNLTMEERRLDALAKTAPRQRGQWADQAVSGSSRALAEIQSQIAAASRTLGPNHPRLIALREQERVLEDAAASEAASQRSIPNDASDEDTAIEAQRAQVIAQGEDAGELRRMAANVELLREQYAQLAGRAVGTEQLAQSQDVGLAPIGPASTPLAPAFPNVKLIVALAFCFGLGWGILTALLIEFLGMKVRHAEDLKVAEVPVFRSNTAVTDQKAQIAPWWRRLWPRRRQLYPDGTHLATS